MYIFPAIINSPQLINVNCFVRNVMFFWSYFTLPLREIQCKNKYLQTMDDECGIHPLFVGGLNQERNGERVWNHTAVELPWKVAGT